MADETVQAVASTTAGKPTKRAEIRESIDVSPTSLTLEESGQLPASRSDRQFAPAIDFRATCGTQAACLALLAGSATPARAREAVPAARKPSRGRQGAADRDGGGASLDEPARLRGGPKQARTKPDRSAEAARQSLGTAVDSAVVFTIEYCARQVV